MRINIFWTRNIHLFFREICECLCLCVCSHLYPYRDASFYSFSMRNSSWSANENENESHVCDADDRDHSPDPYSPSHVPCCHLCPADNLSLSITTVRVRGKSIVFAVLGKMALLVANIALVPGLLEVIRSPVISLAFSLSELYLQLLSLEVFASQSEWLKDYSLCALVADSSV